jgi:hypothetical protein
MAKRSSRIARRNAFENAGQAVEDALAAKLEKNRAAAALERRDEIKAGKAAAEASTAEPEQEKDNLRSPTPGGTEST